MFDSCDPMDCSPPGFSVHGISQTRTLEWGALSSSRGSSWPRDRASVSCIAGSVLHCRVVTTAKNHDQSKGKVGDSWAIKENHRCSNKKLHGTCHTLNVRVCCASLLGRVWFFATPWTGARQAPLSWESSRQEYWSGVAMPSSRGSYQPGDWTRVSHIAGGFFTTEPQFTCSDSPSILKHLGIGERNGECFICFFFVMFCHFMCMPFL